MADLQDTRTAIMALVYDAINFEDPATATRASYALSHVLQHHLFANASAKELKALPKAARALKKKMRTKGSLADLASRITGTHRETALKLVAMALAADGRVTAAEDAYWRRLGAALGFSRLKALEIFHNGLLTHMQRFGAATQDPAPEVSDDARRAILALVCETTLRDGAFTKAESRRTLERVMFHPLFVHLAPRDLLALQAQALEELKALPAGGEIGPLAARVPKELAAQAFELVLHAAYADGAFDVSEAGLLVDLANALGLSAEDAKGITKRAAAEHIKQHGAIKTE
jgi:tellurite resistance protein